MIEAGEGGHLLGTKGMVGRGGGGLHPPSRGCLVAYGHSAYRTDPGDPGRQVWSIALAGGRARDTSTSSLTRSARDTSPPCQYGEPEASRSPPRTTASSLPYSIPSRAVAIHSPSPPPTVHARRAPQADRRLDAAGPFSPACGPIFILRPGKASWAPGLQPPRLRLPLRPREGPQPVPGRSLPGDATPRVCARPPAMRASARGGQQEHFLLPISVPE